MDGLGELARAQRGMLWIGQQNQLERDVETLVALGRDRPDLGGDPAFVDAVVDLWVDAQAMKAMGYDAPFGGFKTSGLGREGGYPGIEAFTAQKTVTVATGPSPS